MCHMYPDPDKFIKDMQEHIAKEVIDTVMAEHNYATKPPRPLRVTNQGLIFFVNHPVDIRADTIAGEIIQRELMSLGFIGISFYGSELAHVGTVIEFCLTTLERFEKYQAELAADEELESV